MKVTKTARATPVALKPRVEQLFDRFFHGPEFDDSGMSVFETVWAPTLDLSETDKEFVLRMEAPGVNRENMDVHLEGNVLTVSGRREIKKEGESEEYLWKEREEGKFMRAIRFPKPIAEGKVDASYEDGVLTVRLVKSTPSSQAKISIR